MKTWNDEKGFGFIGVWAAGKVGKKQRAVWGVGDRFHLKIFQELLSSFCVFY